MQHGKVTVIHLTLIVLNTIYSSSKSKRSPDTQVTQALKIMQSAIKTSAFANYDLKINKAAPEKI